MKKVLKKRDLQDDIVRYKEKINKLIQNNEYALQNEEIQNLSKELDEFISKYYEQKNND